MTFHGYQTTRVTRQWCEDSRDFSRLRLCLAAANRPGVRASSADALTRALLRSAARSAERPLWPGDPTRSYETHLPEDVVQHAHRVRLPVRPALAAAARLVVRAAEPWSPASHELWPSPARAYVRALLLVGVRMPVPHDVWVAHVMPHVVWRCGPIPRCEDCDCAPCECGD